MSRKSKEHIVDFVFFFKQKTAYEITRRDWSSDVCSSDLEVAARPIGGLCARALRFKRGRESFPSPDLASLEELLLRHSLGESPEKWGRESFASGVMMIPIPRRGVFRRV